MNNPDVYSLSSVQRVMLVVLRTLIGWHFLYEGYYKLVLPGWGADGKPIGPWSSSGYLKAATGPLANLLRPMSGSGWLHWVDRLVEIGLLLVGLSLMLGLLVRLGCWGAVFFLSLFYLTAIPLAGTPQTGNEGTYLLVNKNLIELAAVLVLLVFRTGEIAGLDLLWSKAAKRAPDSNEAMAEDAVSV
ncbi:MAG TPA: DoxX subfamily [Blastocatellia bacterium]|nr:DoxX subfamily [Blastocatellia bacterium]